MFVRFLCDFILIFRLSFIYYFVLLFYLFRCYKYFIRATLGQGIRTGGAVVPITGPGGLQTYSTSTIERRSNGNLRVSLPFIFSVSLKKFFLLLLVIFHDCMRLKFLKEIFFFLIVIPTFLPVNDIKRNYRNIQSIIPILHFYTSIQYENSLI